MIIMKNKNFTPLIWTLAIAINGLIALSFALPKLGALQGYDLSGLPALNAGLNALTFVSLLLARRAITRGHVACHRAFVFAAFCCTGLFLFSYLLYHFSTASTPYGGPHTLRYIYLLILISHIILAIIIVPLALVTIGLGLNSDPRHRRIAQWTMPIWLYVSLSGVVVYLMIAPYYTHAISGPWLQ
jgi:putative membrane protein